MANAAGREIEVDAKAEKSGVNTETRGSIRVEKFGNGDKETDGKLKKQEDQLKVLAEIGKACAYFIGRKQRCSEEMDASI